MSDNVYYVNYCLPFSNHSHQLQIYINNYYYKDYPNKRTPFLSLNFTLSSETKLSFSFYVFIFLRFIKSGRIIKNSMSRSLKKHFQLFSLDLNNASTNRFGSNDCKSSIFSPTPMYLTGTLCFSQI